VPRDHLWIYRHETAQAVPGRNKNFDRMSWTGEGVGFPSRASVSGQT